MSSEGEPLGFVAVEEDPLADRIGKWLQAGVDSGSESGDFAENGISTQIPLDRDPSRPKTNPLLKKKTPKPRLDDRGRNKGEEQSTNKEIKKQSKTSEALDKKKESKNNVIIKSAKTLNNGSRGWVLKKKEKKK